MRYPLAISHAAARLSAEMPTRNAACRSGRGAGFIARGGLGARGGELSRCVIAAVLLAAVFGERERALIDLAARTAGGERHFADRVLDRDAR